MVRPCRENDRGRSKKNMDGGNENMEDVNEWTPKERETKTEVSDVSFKKT